LSREVVGIWQGHGTLTTQWLMMFIDIVPKVAYTISVSSFLHTKRVEQTGCKLASQKTLSNEFRSLPE
jgi:hypothetical protein